ncbi:hypothetical protein OAG36_00620 [bacterium]|nr:hypothetical protein [bacterium]
MAVDSKQKRFSAMNLRCPWRGPNIVPTGVASQAIRQASAFLYSGISATASASFDIICFTSEALAVGSFSSEAFVAGSFSSEAFAIGSFSSESLVECP